MNAKILVFVICVEVIIYLLLHNLHDCTFNCDVCHFPLSLFLLSSNISFTSLEQFYFYSASLYFSSAFFLLSFTVFYFPFTIFLLPFTSFLLSFIIFLLPFSIFFFFHLLFFVFLFRLFSPFSVFTSLQYFYTLFIPF